MEDQFPTRSGGIDLLGERAEPNSLLLEFGDDLDQVFEGAAESVQSPDNQRVSLPYVEEGVVESSATLLRSGDDIGVDRLATIVRERILLEI